MGKWPGGQRQLTVNQPGKPYSGSNPLLPTKKDIPFAWIAKGMSYEPHEMPLQQVENLTQEEMRRSKFEPYKGKVRRSGTGGIYELNDHLFEGRYSPTNAHGKREVHTVYAKTKAECEVLLEQMIAEVREQIKEEKLRMKEVSADQKPQWSKQRNNVIV